MHDRVRQETISCSAAPIAARSAPLGRQTNRRAAGKPFQLWIEHANLAFEGRRQNLAQRHRPDPGRDAQRPDSAAWPAGGGRIGQGARQLAEQRLRFGRHFPHPLIGKGLPGKIHHAELMVFHANQQGTLRQDRDAAGNSCTGSGSENRSAPPAAPRPPTAPRTVRARGGQWRRQRQRWRPSSRRSSTW